ncbi:hypothetical protein NUM3379_28530 [Kineococcus sp. NUM-3379]
MAAAAAETEDRQATEPTPQALGDIEAEWPLIAAEVELVNAEVAALAASSAMCDLARRRVRRAEVRVAAEARAWAVRRHRAGSAGTEVAA